MPSASGEGGVEHHHSDFYSQENPIPSIQRFLNKGVGAIVSRRGRSRSDDEASTDEESDDDDATSAGPSSLRTRPSGKGRAEAPKSPTSSSTKSRLSGIFARRSRDSKNGHDAAPGGANDDESHATFNSDDEKAPEQRARDKEQRKDRKRGKPVQVLDPITQEMIEVRDVRKKDYRRMMEREDARRQGRSFHEPDPPQNVAASPFPPAQPLPATLLQVHPMIVPLWAAWSLGLILFFRSAAATAFIAGNAWILWWAFRRLRLGVEDGRWQRELERGLAARSGKKCDACIYGDLQEDENSEGTKEGAEWLNSILQALWEVIDPAIFDTVAGTLEDVMQASAPNFIHSIKVSEVAHGLTPIRIAGLKILPDSEAKYVSPDEGVDKDNELGDNKVEASPTKSGKHINIEAAVIYHASETGPAVASRRKNARLVMQFWLGLRKVATFPLPVWVEIKGFVGTIRARLQLTPEAPFIKNVTVTFLGLPRVSVEVVPLKVNLANIPVLSGFVQSSIDAALSEYCAPSSLTLDVGEILMGDSIKREVNALGVIVVCIHSAHDLEKQDRFGSSDPYVTISYSRLGKISYATRVALNDLNPKWEERHVMLLNPEAIRAKERLSIALWDSDRTTADDILGRVEIDIAPLIRSPGQMFERDDTLMGLSNQHKKQGQIQWSVGFFRKVSNRIEDAQKQHEKDAGRRASDSLDKEAKANESGDAERSASRSSSRTGSVSGSASSDGAGSGDSQKSEALAKPQDQGEREDKYDDYLALADDTSPGALLRMLDAAESATQTRNQKSSVQFYPPSASHPSGVVSLQVHNITDLEFANAGSANKHRGGEGGMAGASAQLIDDVEDENESPDAPSAYVSIVLNDQTVMVSRVKALSNAPFFNIGTERFIRDWRRSFVMVVVRDRRLRESDPILGVVPIKLSDLFNEHGTSQVTQYYPMGGGIGRGRVRISVLFRPVEGMHLSKEKLGFDIGTMRVHTCPVASDLTDSTLRLASLRMRTLAGRYKISSRQAHRISTAGSEERIEWRVPPSKLFLRVPARRRYAAPFVFEFRKPNALGVKTLVAASMIWMQDVNDDDIFDAALPIYRGDPDLHRLLQNYHYYRNEEEALGMGVKRIGTLHVQLQFKSGIGAIHAKLDHNPDSRAVMEAWKACVAAGLRSSTGDFAETRREEAEDGEGQDSEGESESGPEGGEGTREKRSGTADEDSGGSDDGDDGDDDEEEDGLREKFKKWRLESKELHRQHKGIKAHKPVRTASWLVSSAKTGSSRLVRNLTVEERGKQQIDSELA